MNRLKLELKTAFNNQVALGHADSEMPKLLAELRAVVADPAQQRQLGMFVLTLFTARLKAGIHAEKAIQAAIGSRGHQ